MSASGVSATSVVDASLETMDRLVRRGIMGSSGNGTDGRSLSLVNSAPELTSRITDATGAIVASGAEPIEWVVEGDSGCGGNATAELTIPL